MPDIGIALVEILAYVGDYLSYYQDSVNTGRIVRQECRRGHLGQRGRLAVSFMSLAIGPAPDCALIENISVARGNILLVDNGRTICEDLS